MDRTIMVYFGMGFLPENNAVACRQQVIAQMAQRMGMTPVLIGIKRGLSFEQYEKETYDGIVNYSVKYAGSFKDKIIDNFVIQKTLWRILEEIGVDKIRMFLMQDYQWLPMKQMKKLCEKHGIAFAADIMDWFTPTSDYSLPKNIFKTVDTYVRMHWFYPKLKNRMYISHKFAEFFGKRNANELVLPCTAKDGPCSVQDPARGNITLTFAGSPGPKFEKEKLDWIIKALYENKSNIHLEIIGISEETCLAGNGYLQEYLTDRIHFLGRIPHEECVDRLQKSDFSLVVRQVNKLTTYGFSSKVCEAFANGIPVIATDTSDNSRYIQNGVNGFVCAPSYQALKMLLQQVENMSRADVNDMKHNLINHNPLSMQEYGRQLQVFIDELRV